MRAGIEWTTAFLDLPTGSFDEVVAFWRAVTGYDQSPYRGEASEFATLIPTTGTDFLRVQRLGSASARVHLDLHVADPTTAAARAVPLGAAVVADVGYVVMRSPGGFVFCFVPNHGSMERPAASQWGSLVDQIALDVPPGVWEAECEFWTALTGWPLASSALPEFRSLVRPIGMPLRILLQRLESEPDSVSAHLDIACADRALELERHRELGAIHVGDGPRWSVLRDPAGSPYCLTDRDPATGLLPG
ncbi:VOC family protein [Promicromonospora sp. NPDC057138]|uniref:VOC family protein n=1 Tax=Promicromonospora sp. NPDC057138 TaxID=3346031 RepID=UPI0036315434